MLKLYICLEKHRVLHNPHFGVALNDLGSNDHRTDSEIGTPSTRLEMNRNRFRNIARMSQVRNPANRVYEAPDRCYIKSLDTRTHV